uniref:Uncharacterized protein n=1 Tax=Romanomermis culicivorax TaxID=13658 RepID=A0A915I2X8_ROMCU
MYLRWVKAKVLLSAKEEQVPTFDKSMLEKLLNHYIAGVFGYVPDNFKSKLNLEVNYDQYWKRWLEPEFYKDIHLKFDRFYIHGIVGYEFVHNIWHRERSYLNTVLDKSPTCLTMLAPEYGGYLEMTLTDLNSPTEIRFEITYARTRKRWPIDRPILAMNYTVAEFPAFQSYNPLLGSFLAEPNTMPWIVDLEDGYAVLLNESEITGVGRKDRTRFILTTCNQKKQILNFKDKGQTSCTKWSHKPQAIIPLHAESIISVIDGSNLIKTKRPFQRVKEDNPGTFSDTAAIICQILEFMSELAFITDVWIANLPKAR